MAGGVSDRLNWLYLTTYVDAAIPKPDGSRLAKGNGRSAVPVYHTYFDGKPPQGFNGRKALEDYNRLRDKAQPDPDDLKKLEEAKKYLVQIHIEGINALYSDNLQADYFAKLTDDPKKVSSQLYGLAYQTAPGQQGSLAELVRAGGKKDSPGTGLPKAGWIVEIRGFTYHTDSYNFVIATFLENLIDLVDDPANKRVEGIQLPPEVAALIRITEKGENGAEVYKGSRVSYILLYDYVKDENPRPGEFKKINHCLIGDLLLSGTGGGPGGSGGPGNPGMPPGPGKGTPADGSKTPDTTEKKDTKDRSAWRPPSSTVLADAFTGGTGGGMGGYPFQGKKQPGSFVPPGGKEDPGAAPALKRAMRTEFVIHFIWIEPPGATEILGAEPAPKQ